MGVIILSGQEAATNADILQGTRLQTLRPGTLTIEAQNDINDATDNMTLSLQLPNGRTPLNAVRVPSGNTSALAGVIDERTDLQATFNITPDMGGGHAVLSCIETGASILTWRVTNRF